jgi:hypothetical protein
MLDDKGLAAEGDDEDALGCALARGKHLEMVGVDANGRISFCASSTSISTVKCIDFNNAKQGMYISFARFLFT